MSLINKMLQDLDARGTPKNGDLPGQVKPVERAPKGPAPRLIAVAVGAAVAAGALGWLGWTQWHRAPRPAAAAPAAVASARTAPVVTGPMQAAPVVTGPVQTAPVVTGPMQAAPVVTGPVQTAPVVTGPVQAAPVVTGPVQAAPVVTGPVQAPAAAPVEAPRAEPAPESAPAEPSGAVPAGKQHMTRAERRAERKRLAHEKAAARKAEKAGKGRAGHVAPPAPVSAEARARSAKHGAAAHEAARRAAHETAHEEATPKGKRGVQGRQQSNAQRAEGEYRRALASLQEGRMTETVAALEQVLKIEPRHEAARQTLVGLLIEANRNDEAMRQLQLGLTLDPRQPALAMLLARLQIERGGNGIDTLLRTLPYAGNDADYRAFLAGALARQQRHREAAEQYQQAVRAVPSNGVWWMGLGISLQAEKRNGEALDAFQRARASGALSPELQAFVERRIQQLSH